jgi:hypothetical protein
MGRILSIITVGQKFYCYFPVNYQSQNGDVQKVSKVYLGQTRDP